MAKAETTDIGLIFGEVLRRHRTLKDISQEELAHQAGVDRTFISRLERGIRQPTITTLIGLGQALGISAGELAQEVEAEYLRPSQMAANTDSGR